METKLTKWCIKGCTELTQWDRKHKDGKCNVNFSYHERYYFTNDENLLKWDHQVLMPENHTLLTFEQFKEKILNMNTEKKVLGYKAPFDLFGGKIKKETIYRKSKIETNEYCPNLDSYKTDFSCNLPKEIVEQWEKVYEEEYKIGDFVYITNTGFSIKGAKKGDVKVIKSFKNEYDTYYVNNIIFEDDSYGGCDEPLTQFFRKATKEEIQASQQKVITVNNTEIIIKKGSMFAVDKEFNIDYLLSIQGIFDTKVYHTKTWTINVETVKLGCKTGWTKENINTIITKYQEFNN